MSPVLWLAAASALAGFPGERFSEGPVLGAGVVVALGELPEGRSRVGAGVDAWYQVQWWTERSTRLDGEFLVWAQEHPAWNYGPAAHLWWVDGHWSHGVGARFGVAWPLRVGLSDGWWPGPAVAVELGPAFSTAGYAALDAQLAIDATWLQGRVGTGLTPQGLRGSRLHLGPAIPLKQPTGWSGTTADVLRDPRQ